MNRRRFINAGVCSPGSRAFKHHKSQYFSLLVDSLYLNVISTVEQIFVSPTNPALVEGVLSVCVCVY